jgi:hypothetical protein
MSQADQGQAQFYEEISGSPSSDTAVSIGALHGVAGPGWASHLRRHLLQFGKRDLLFEQNIEDFGAASIVVISVKFDLRHWVYLVSAEIARLCAALECAKAGNHDAPLCLARSRSQDSISDNFQWRALVGPPNFTALGNP